MSFCALVFGILSSVRSPGMKRCPKCQQLFSDKDYGFCRFDGAELSLEPTALGDAPTILFSSTRIAERFPWLVHSGASKKVVGKLDPESADTRPC
jgi:hypothetical protein